MRSLVRLALSLSLSLLPFMACSNDDRMTEPTPTPDAGTDSAPMLVDGGHDATADATVDVTDDSATDASDAGVDAPEPSGTFVTLAASVNDPVALSVDGTHVYWLSAGDSAIRRCPLSGCGGAPENVVTGLSVASSVAANSGTIYWTRDFRYLMTCAVGSGAACTPAQFLDIGSGTAFPANLWIFGTRIYWVSENAQARLIQTCPLAGCSAGYPKAIYTSAPGSLIHDAPVAGLVVNATDAYVTNYNGGVIRFAMTDPETVTPGNGTQLQPTAVGTYGLELDSTKMRWGLLNNGKIAECTIPGCTTVTDFITGQLAPGGTRSNATHVYGFNRGTTMDGGASNPNTGSVWRIKK